MLFYQLHAQVFFGSSYFPPGGPVGHAQLGSGPVDGTALVDSLKESQPPAAKNNAVVRLDPYLAFRLQYFVR